MNKYSPKEILEQGNLLDDWACDIGENGMESNAGKEHLIEFDNEYFIIITSIYSGKILGWHKIKKDIEIQEGGFIAKLIQEYEV